MERLAGGTDGGGGPFRRRAARPRPDGSRSFRRRPQRRRPARRQSRRRQSRRRAARGRQSVQDQVGRCRSERGRSPRRAVSALRPTRSRAQLAGGLPRRRAGVRSGDSEPLLSRRRHARIDCPSSRLRGRRLPIANPARDRSDNDSTERAVVVATIPRPPGSDRIPGQRRRLDLLQQVLPAPSLRTGSLIYVSGDKMRGARGKALQDIRRRSNDRMAGAGRVRVLGRGARRRRDRRLGRDRHAPRLEDRRPRLGSRDLFGKNPG